MSLPSARTRRIIPVIRPLRPPSQRSGLVHPRLFANKTPLRFTSRPTGRPQIPFLSSRFGKRMPNTHRPLSTEQLNSIKYQIRLGLYWSILGWTVLGGLSVAYFVLRQDWLDKQYPAPAEWHWYVKYRWRIARYEVLTDGRGLEFVSWNNVGNQYRAVVANLERLRLRWNDKIDPKNVLQDDYDHSIPGISDEVMRSEPEAHPFDYWPSRIGYDVSRQSEQWRRGYYEAMMGVCKSAEMLVGSMRYINGPDANGNTYSPEHIRSQQNPFPKPFPPGMAEMPIPDENDCIPAFESPDFHYLRLLTTKGFSRKQRLDAGVAYALWLDASGRTELAEQMYQWSLDLACQGVSDVADKIVDRKTHVIKSTAPVVTESILSVVTALASHYARHEDTTKALSIYLSLLRARRSAPEAHPSQQYPQPQPDYSLATVGSIMTFISSIARSGKYPETSPTGDEPFERTQQTRCDEAAIMAYVGEILFSRSGRRADGLSWTRDATAAAEQGQADGKLDEATRKVCSQCFATGLENWHKMVSQLASEQQERQQAKAPRADATASTSRSGWLWSASSSSSSSQKKPAVLSRQDAALVDSADWREEERRVRDRVADFEVDRLNRRLSALIRRESSTFVV